MAIEKRPLRDYFHGDMLEDRDYMRRGSAGLHLSATVILIIALVAAFIVQKTVVPWYVTQDYLALSLGGFLQGRVWELVTFQFLHVGLLHLLGNCLVIYFFGRELEWVLGKSRFLTLYFLCGIVGGLFQILGAWAWPSHFGGAVMGASAGGFGLVAAFAALDPNRQLTMLLYFIVPVRMRARTLIYLETGLALAGILLPNSFLGGRVAHAAHLGGILVGLVWIKLGWHRDYIRLPWEGLLGRWYDWHPLRSRRSKRELVNKSAARLRRWPAAESGTDLPSEEFISREVDPILDKISAHGIQSLTERERKILEAARNKMAKR